MTPPVAAALEGIGVGLVAVGLAFALSALDLRVGLGAALIVVGLYCALAANVSGANADESGTRDSSTTDPAQRR